MKGSSVLQNIYKGMGSLWKGGVNLFFLLQLFTGGQGQIISLGVEQRLFSLQSVKLAGSSEAGHYL